MPSFIKENIDFNACKAQSGDNDEKINQCHANQMRDFYLAKVNSNSMVLIGLSLSLTLEAKIRKTTLIQVAVVMFFTKKTLDQTLEAKW